MIDTILSEPGLAVLAYAAGWILAARALWAGSESYSSAMYRI